jgi:hypothetical protein
MKHVSTFFMIAVCLTTSADAWGRDEQSTMPVMGVTVPFMETDSSPVAQHAPLLCFRRIHDSFEARAASTEAFNGMKEKEKKCVVGTLWSACFVDRVEGLRQDNGHNHAPAMRVQIDLAEAFRKKSCGTKIMTDKQTAVVKDVRAGFGFLKDRK